MIALDPSLVLQAVMASATGTTEPVVHVVARTIQQVTKDSFEDYQRRITRTVMSGSTNVTICDSPQTNECKLIEHIAIVNRSADTEIFTVSTYDGSNRYPILNAVTLTTGQTLVFEECAGWSIH